MNPKKTRKKDEEDPFRASFRLPVTRTRFVEVEVLEIPPLLFATGAAALARIIARLILYNSDVALGVVGLGVWKTSIFRTMFYNKIDVKLLVKIEVMIMKMSSNNVFGHFDFA